jgi:hypothetical protein
MFNRLPSRGGPSKPYKIPSIQSPHNQPNGDVFARDCAIRHSVWGAQAIRAPCHRPANGELSIHRVVPCAASRIKPVITSGWEISETWLAFTSMVLAPMRLAMNRSRSGLMVRSSVETA